MVAPLLIAGGIASGLSAFYTVGKAVDNVRYWNDYYRRTGYRPRYPFARGYHDWMNYSSRLAGVPYLYSRWR